MSSPRTVTAVAVKPSKSAPKAITTGDKIKPILIPPLEITQTVIEIVGTSPLITHKWSEKAKKEMRDKHMGHATLKKEPKDPDADFNAARYLDAKGRDCVPGLAFKNAAVEAGVMVNVFKTTLRKAFFVTDELIPLTFKGRPVMREDMVRNSNGQPDIRYRPMYEEWSCKVKVQFNPRMITAEQLVNLFNNAGASVGICEWRPEKDGIFGRFQVKLG